jgi:hypothetical protein
MIIQIIQLNRSLPDSIVITIDYRITKGLSSITGIIDIPSPTGEPIPFADLTEEIVTGWLADNLDFEQIEANLTERNDEITNPTSARGLPWQSESTESAQVDEAE